VTTSPSWVGSPLGPSQDLLQPDAGGRRTAWGPGGGHAPQAGLETGRRGGRRRRNARREHMAFLLSLLRLARGHQQEPTILLFSLVKLPRAGFGPSLGTCHHGKPPSHLRAPHPCCCWGLVCPPGGLGTLAWPTSALPVGLAAPLRQGGGFGVNPLLSALGSLAARTPAA